MTRRTIIFRDMETGAAYATPEFNGDKEELDLFHSQDYCEKNWPDIFQEFKAVKTLNDFIQASAKAQGYYHSSVRERQMLMDTRFIGDKSFLDDILPVVQVCENEIKKLGDTASELEMWRVKG